MVAHIVTRGTAAQTNLSASSVLWAGAAMTRFESRQVSGAGVNFRSEAYYISEPQATAGTLTVSIQATATSFAGAANITGTVSGQTPVTAVADVSVATTVSGTFTSDNLFVAFVGGPLAVSGVNQDGGFMNIWDSSPVVGAPGAGSNVWNAMKCGFGGFVVSQGSQNKTILMRLTGVTSNECVVGTRADIAVGGVTSPTTASWAASVGLGRVSANHTVSAGVTHLVGFVYVLSRNLVGVSAAFNGIPFNVFSPNVVLIPNLGGAIAKRASAYGLSIKNPPATASSIVYTVSANTSVLSDVALVNIFGGEVNKDITPFIVSSDLNAATENLVNPGTAAIISIGIMDASAADQSEFFPPGAVQRMFIRVSATTTTGTVRLGMFTMATSGTAAMEAPGVSAERETTWVVINQGTAAPVPPLAGVAGSRGVSDRGAVELDDVFVGRATMVKWVRQSGLA